jgi:hypothetical protein
MTFLPFVISGIATVVMAGASGVATFVSQVKPLPTPVMEVHTKLPEVPVERNYVRLGPAEAPSQPTARRPSSNEGGEARSRRLSRPTASAAPALPTTPPKPPPFNSAAAVAGLDAAQANAQASCKGADGVRLFVQIGFDPDGVNRRAALSDPKFKSTPEAKCTLRIFRAVRIPAFDPATKPSGLGRVVRL